MRPTGALSSLPWLQAFILVSPGFALLVAGFAFGAGNSTGLALLLSGQAYVIVDLAILQPWLARQRSARFTAVPHWMAWCGQRLATCTSVAELSAILAAANQLIAGSDRTLLVLRPGAGPGAGPGPGTSSPAGIEIHGGTAADHHVILHSGDSVAWLNVQRQVVVRTELGDVAGPAVLLDALDCQVVLPLRDSGVAIGIVLARVDLASIDEAIWQAYRWMCAAASTALARLQLEFNMREALELVGIVDYARATQQALMPDDRPIAAEGVRLRGVFRPAAQCGGDLWAWRRLGQGRILVVIGDVTGHGVVPAVISATAAGAVHASAFVYGPALDPAVLLAEVNRSLYRVAKGSYMMTALALIADCNAGEIRYANAGQNFPYLITPARAAAGKPRLEVLVARGPMLGSSMDVRFECHRHPLSPGQKLFLYTDGIIEAELAKHHNFGERRLRRTLLARAGDSADAIATGVLDELRQFLMGRPWSDDITIVVVERPELARLDGSLAP